MGRLFPLLLCVLPHFKGAYTNFYTRDLEAGEIGCHLYRDIIIVIIVRNGSYGCDGVRLSRGIQAENYALSTLWEFSINKAWKSDNIPSWKPLMSLHKALHNVTNKE